MTPASFHNLLATNRAEELGYDVWQQFVVPPYYEKLSIGDTRKPIVIIGGRGCGKTMLLRYLSHESTFSPSRSIIPPNTVRHIGLYWRSDTQFASLMQHRQIPDDTWYAAFRHLAAVVLGIEILRSIESIAKSSVGLLSQDRLEGLDFSRLKPFSSDLPPKPGNLRRFLEDELAAFQTWVNDVRSGQQPRFLPGDAFLKRMIALIREQVVELNTAVFFVYIDEYENLTEYQQRVINTWLKHSEPPLIFNLAMKRNGFKTRATEGAETLSDIHDYRDIDLEAFDLEREFPIFAAEILLLRMQLAGHRIAAIDPDWLRDTSRLSQRSARDYVDGVLNAIKGILPSLTHRELASAVFVDSFLRERLKDRIVKALQSRNESQALVDEFVLPQFPEASVIMPALICRDSLPINELKAEVGRLVGGDANKFTGPTNWIHNNFVGCYLQLFDGLVRACPIYSGFTTYCYMARGNLRHFMELCHHALSRSYVGQDGFATVTIEMQAEAARQVATDLLAEVRSFGAQGNNLHTFVVRLGSLFSLAQQQPTQSEPERAHFSIQGGGTEIGEDQLKFLSEAIKWSVLFEEKSTKKKDDADPEGTEYVLNPIYAPYFHITYRKRRRLELSATDAVTLISRPYEDVKRLLREYRRRWSVDLSESSLPLFAHLDTEARE
jgi:hypothetical protein